MENHQYVPNPTNLSIADLLKGSPNPSEAAEIMSKWYSKMIGVDPSSVKTIIVDGNNVFPVFYADTFETLIERYSKMYPIEAKATMEFIADNKKDNPDGMSKSHLLQSIMTIPTILKAAIVYQYGEQWLADKKNLRKLASIMPKFFTCNTDRL